MDDGNYCKETESNIIGTQDGARVVLPRTAATSYQAAVANGKTKIEKMMGLFSTLTDLF